MNLLTFIRRSNANPVFVEVARKWVDRLSSMQSEAKPAEGISTLTDPFPILRDAVLDRAYAIAIYVLGDAVRAKKVAVEVASFLEVPYRIVVESSASSGKPVRKYKVKEPALLLDQLIHAKTTVQERQQEMEHRNGRFLLTEEAMIIRYVKKIMEYSITHNTFYMVAGLYRVLFNYPISDARKIYQLLVTGSDNKKPSADDFRHHKKRFIDLLERRFKGFVEIIESGDQNERRFKKRHDSYRCHLLVEQILDLLKPSLLDCPPLPDQPENMDDARRSLYSHASTIGSEDENLIERTRMHMLSHFFCFSRLRGFLGLAPTEQVLEIPMFHLTDNGDGADPPPFNRQISPQLTAEDKARMYAELDRRQKRSKKAPLKQVEVVVDEIGRGTLSLDESRPIVIDLEEGASLIEFRGSDNEGDVSLGMHSLSWDENTASEEPESYRMKMTGGREVKFSIAHTRDINGALIGAKFVCSYEKVEQPIVVKEWLSQLLPSPTLKSVTIKLTIMVVSMVALGGLLHLTTKEKPGGDVIWNKSAEATLPALDSSDTSTQMPTATTASDQEKNQVAQLTEQTLPVASQADTRRVKPSINETVTVRAEDDLHINHYISPPLAMLTNEIDRSAISSYPPSVLAPGTEVVTLPVSPRSFVKLTDLPQGRELVNGSASAFLASKHIFIKPFPRNTISQNVYSSLVKDLRASRYIISQDVSRAEIILEGNVIKNASGVTLNMLINNSDGSYVWLKSINSPDMRGDERRVAANLSAKAIKSLSEERQENSYVALDYYISRTKGVQNQSSTKTSGDETVTKAHDGSEAHSGGGVAQTPSLSGF
jgi:hypothetical protein